jgi:hypothetical protein
MANEYLAPIITFLLLGDPIMAQAPEFKPPYNFNDSTVVSPVELQQTIMELSNTVNQLRANQLLLIRDDGTPIGASIGIANLSAEVTGLLNNLASRATENSNGLATLTDSVIEIADLVNVNTDDITGLTNPTAFFQGAWSTGTDYTVGQQFTFDGVLYYVAVDHTSSSLISDVAVENVYQVSTDIRPGKAIQSYVANYDSPTLTYSFTTGSTLGYRDGESWYVVVDSDNTAGNNFFTRDGLSSKRITVRGQELLSDAFVDGRAELIRYNQATDAFEVIGGRYGDTQSGVRNVQITADANLLTVIADSAIALDSVTGSTRVLSDINATYVVPATNNTTTVGGLAGDFWWRVFLICDEDGLPELKFTRIISGSDDEPPTTVSQPYGVYVGVVKTIINSGTTNYILHKSLQVGDEVFSTREDNGAAGFDTLSINFSTDIGSAPGGYAQTQCNALDVPMDVRRINTYFALRPDSATPNNSATITPKLIYKIGAVDPSGIDGGEYIITGASSDGEEESGHIRLPIANLQMCLSMEQATGLGHDGHKLLLSIGGFQVPKLIQI